MTDQDFANEIAQLRATPVADILGNHFIVLVQLTTMHLAATPPNLDEARLLIDTMAAMVEAGGDRLGEHITVYRAALAEAQQLYVRAAGN
jgi:hypothetical protein